MYPFNDESYYMYPKTQYYRPNNFNMRRVLALTSKSIYTINQIIPLINQIQPLINNTMSGIRIIKAMNHIDDINLDDVIDSINVDVNSEEKFENMI